MALYQLCIIIIIIIIIEKGFLSEEKFAPIFSWIETST